MPGRISAVHCMDVPKDGANLCGYRDFPGDIIRLHERLGSSTAPHLHLEGAARGPQPDDGQGPRPPADRRGLDA
jgi:hypothetical protein